jgi:ATP-binding cassette subfamily C protein LapB
MTKESAATHDPLLQCLVHLTAHYGQAQSGESLTSNLAYTDKGMDIPLFQQAALNARLRTKLDKRDLKSITSELCPVVLVMQGNEAVVLHDITDDGKAHVCRPSENKKRTLKLET